MSKRSLALILIGCIIPCAVSAQQSSQSTEEVRRLLTVIEQQRNSALSWHAQAEAKAMNLAEENARLRQQIDLLSQKIKPSE